MGERHHRNVWHDGSSKQSDGGQASILQRHSQRYLGSDVLDRIIMLSEESESESERYLFDPHKKFIQSNNEKHLGSEDPY